MRIIIAGGRDFDNYKLLQKSCHEIFYELSKNGFLTGSIDKDIKNMEIICGMAQGADRLGELFAEKYNIKVKYFSAKWNELGKSAGYKRNEEMALYAKEDNGVLIAFWNKTSKGTAHMIDLANKHGLKIFVINY